MLNNALKQILLGILCLCVIALPNLALGQADKIYANNNQAVVVIITHDKDAEPLAMGSGFIVRSDGVIVTNLHVVSNAVSIKVKIANDKYLEVEGVLYSDVVNDLVILKVKGVNLPVVKLGDSDKIKPGEKVYVIGSPEGLENSITDGIISGIREPSRNQKVIQISAPISHGSSGGPVFNEKGEAIAVATSMLEDAQNLNFAMPVNLIKDKINNKKILPLAETVVTNYTETAEYWFWSGYYLYGNGKYKEAIESYKQTIRIKPDYAEAHYNLGIAYDELKNYPKAIESYKQAIRIKPDFVDAYLGLGNAYGKSGDDKKTIESYKQAIRIKPDYADVHFSLGFYYGLLGDYPKAIELYKQAIRIKPDYADAHYNLGLTYLIVDNLSSALEEYKILKDLDKELSGNLFDSIIEPYKQAIRIKPDLAEAHYNLGILYGQLGDWRKAIESYKQAICIKPDFAVAHYGLGASYYKLGDYKKAIESFKEAIRLNPDFARAHYNLGCTYGELGDYKKAVESFKQAIRLNSDYAEAHYHLGLTYFNIGDRDNALEEYKILKKLDKELADKLFNIIYKEGE